MSCDDKDGKPDLAARKAAAASRAAAPRTGTPSQGGGRSFGAPALSPEEMAEFLAEYAPLPSAQEIMNSFSDSGKGAGK